MRNTSLLLCLIAALAPTTVITGSDATSEEIQKKIETEAAANIGKHFGNFEKKHHKKMWDSVVRAGKVLKEGSVAYAECQWSPPGYSDVHYDLSALRRPTGDPYHVKDSHEEVNRTYVFNVCGVVTTNQYATPTCFDTPGAWRDGQEHAPNKEPEGLAFQVIESMRQSEDWGCWRLGGSNATEDVRFEMLDPYDPTRGVKITYTHGDRCGQAERNRELTLNFACDDDVENIPDEEAVEEEAMLCKYEMWLTSAYACPTKCKIHGGHVCGNHGICGFHKANRTAQCFCADGFVGDDCSIAVDSADLPSKHTTGWSGFDVGMLILVILLTLALAGLSVAGAYVYLKAKEQGFSLQDIATPWASSAGDYIAMAPLS